MKFSRENLAMKTSALALTGLALAACGETVDASACQNQTVAAGEDVAGEDCPADEQPVAVETVTVTTEPEPTVSAPEALASATPTETSTPAETQTSVEVSAQDQLYIDSFIDFDSGANMPSRQTQSERFGDILDSTLAGEYRVENAGQLHILLGDVEVVGEDIVDAVTGEPIEPQGDLTLHNPVAGRGDGDDKYHAIGRTVDGRVFHVPYAHIDDVADTVTSIQMSEIDGDVYISKRPQDDRLTMTTVDETALTAEGALSGVDLRPDQQGERIVFGLATVSDKSQYSQPKNSYPALEFAEKYGLEFDQDDTHLMDDHPAIDDGTYNDTLNDIRDHIVENANNS